MVSKDLRFERLHTELEDIKERHLSQRASYAVNLIEHSVTQEHDWVIYDDLHIVKLLYGKDFGMVFNFIGYEPMHRQWIVMGRNKNIEIVFDTLIDTVLYLKSIHDNLNDGVYHPPYG